ncbi:hypothetical protein AXG89_07485 [Burkholderia sp. PAMC 26561]|nr:hypothetical protein AXG89_07485 [Burkholderia sp. PAMC 26561]
MLLVVVVFALWHWPYLSVWLSTVTHGEIYPTGIRVDRAVQTQQAISKYSERAATAGMPFSLDFAQAAVTLAARTAPALAGATVLWVDDKPGNNQFLVEALASFGISVIRAYSTQEAIERLDRDSYSLVISNVNRPKDVNPSVRLSNCPVRYFDWPRNVDPVTHGKTLDEFTKESNESPQAGLALVELIRQKSDVPVIIFTSASAHVLADRCTEMVTDRGDILLQYVVSALALTRWRLLSGKDADNWAADTRPSSSAEVSTRVPYGAAASAPLGASRGRGGASVY